MKKLKVLRILIICCLSVFLNSGLFPASDSIIFLTGVDIETLDPAKSSDSYSGEVLNNIFEGLVRVQKDMIHVEPGLAEKWETSESGKIWDFFLKKGVKFHNGKIFDADDVVFTFTSRMQDREKFKYWNLYYSNLVSRVIRLDKFKVRFILKTPYAPFLFQMATTSALIVASNSMKSDSFSPMGTGPFKFRRWEKGKFVSIVRFDGYHGKKAKVSKVIFKVVNNPAWRLLQMKTGKGDLSFITSGKEYSEIKTRKNLSVSSYPSTTIHYIGFNVKKKPFNNIKVRKAFAHLLNKRYLIKNVFQNFAKNATTPVPPHIFGFNNKIRDYSYDLKKAADLLKEAGYRQGLKVKLIYSSSTSNLTEIASVLSRSARKINIRIEKIPMAFQELRSFVASGKHEMFMLGWQGNIPDPDVFLYPVFSNSEGNLNKAGYYNPLVIKLLGRGRREIDPEKRRKIYFRIQDIIHNDVPWIPLYNLNDILVYDRSLSNVSVNVFSLIYFGDVVKE